MRLRPAARLAEEVGRRLVRGNVPGRPLAPWRVLEQLLPVPRRRLVMPLALRQGLLAPGRVGLQGPEGRR
ncbi:MAG: hypothetical protein ACRDRO_00395 [Pseudonocardiaceae bacterium]